MSSANFQQDFIRINGTKSNAERWNRDGSIIPVPKLCQTFLNEFASAAVKFGTTS